MLESMCPFPSQASSRQTTRARRVAMIVVPLLLAALPAVAEPPGGLPDPSLAGVARETTGAGQSEAERIFATAEAAIWFPDSGLVRWFEPRRGVARDESRALETLAEFTDGIDRILRSREGVAAGPYLLKLPAVSSRRADAPGSEAPAEATVVAESFESGLGAWQLDDNSLGLYSWGTTTCAARTGSRSADAMRGGANGLGCNDAYGANVETTMVHAACEGIAGASQAWLDAWVHVASESGYDTLGFFYAAATGTRYGYRLSGTWSAWFRLVFDLKQWPIVGDVTATSCPRLLVEFVSDADTQSGIGARIDDLTISNSTPSFLSCSINASPSGGVAPLNVAFSPVVTGGTATTAYLWSFYDASGAAIGSATSASTSFTFTSPGDYPVRLRVEDQGIRAYAFRTISVTAPGSCTLSCSASVPTAAAAGSPVDFRAGATATGCAEAPSYSWSFGDGQASTLQSPSHTYANAGTYGWSLTVRASGQSCVRSGSIAVSAAAAPRKRPVRRAPGDDTVASAAIGPSGGTLAGGGFSLTVPPGAFASTANLTLMKSPAAGRDPEDVTDTFVLRGMPEAVSGSLTLAIERSGAGTGLGSGEAYYLSVAAPAYLRSAGADGADAPASFPVVATLAGNALTASIPPAWSGFPSGSATSRSAGGRAEAAPDARPRSEWDYEMKGERLRRLETAHFYALALSSEAERAQAILSLLESHYAMLTGRGFSFDCRNGAGGFRKIPVDPAPLGSGSDDPLGYHVSKSDACGAGSWFTDYLQITTSYAPSSQEVRLASAHELFHLVQDMYSPGGPRANLWLKEASSIWIETELGGCPSVQQKYIVFPWRGLFNARGSAVEAFWTTDREQRHGYGAAYALEFRTDASGVVNDPFVRSVWDEVRAGRSEIEAVQNALGTSLPEYWRSFAKSYFTGQATGGCYPTHASFDQTSVTGLSALPATFSIDAYPLSAKSWSLNLGGFSAGGEVSASIEAKGLAGGQSVFVWDTKARSFIAELTASTSKHSIADLNKLAPTIFVLVLVDGNLPVTGDPASQGSTNRVELSLDANVGLRTTVIRDNLGTGDHVPSIHEEWLVDAAGARLAPTGNGALVWVDAKTINVKGRISYKAPAPGYSSCYNGTCTQFAFLGFTGREELWCHNCGELGTAKLVATAASPGAWMEAKGLALTGLNTSVGVDFEQPFIRIYYRTHYKQWDEKTGAIIVDETRETFISEGIRIEDR